jgi:sugar phosphate isomerase/epimerase
MAMNALRSNRREWLAGSAAAACALAAGQAARPALASERKEPFLYCLNTSTIRGQELGIEREIEIAASAGYDAIEPWLDSLHRYVDRGGSLKELGKRIADAGLKVESAIGFAQWLVDDEEARRKGLEQARRDMDAVLQIGGRRIAAPPAGVQNQPPLELAVVVQRYRALLEVGERMMVAPQCEVWGFSPTLGKLSEAMYVAIESDHPLACVLTDVYHLYKGGSGTHGLRLTGPQCMHVIHFNDYPAEPGRAAINDSHRIYPGDGVAPLIEILRDLNAVGFRGALSLELFNRELWKQDPVEVARTGLLKMRALVEKSSKAASPS